MKILLCSCDWQGLINATPWLLVLAIIASSTLVGYYLYLKYDKLPCIKNSHESEMKKAAFEREVTWEKIKKEDTEKNLKQKVDNLTIDNSYKEKELELVKANVETLKKEIALYKEAFENINIEIRPKSNNK